MLLKLGVDISRLADPMRQALNKIEAVFQKYGLEPVITSTYEGTHSPSSFHYVNRAVDLRLPSQALRNQVVSDLKAALPGFDVVLESNHIHVEHDPK